MYSFALNLAVVLSLYPRGFLLELNFFTKQNHWNLFHSMHVYISDVVQRVTKRTPAPGIAEKSFWKQQSLRWNSRWHRKIKSRHCIDCSGNIRIRKIFSKSWLTWSPTLSELKYLYVNKIDDVIKIGCRMPTSYGGLQKADICIPSQTTSGEWSGLNKFDRKSILLHLKISEDSSIILLILFPSFAL